MRRSRTTAPVRVGGREGDETQVRGAGRRAGAVRGRDMTTIVHRYSVIV